MLKAGRIDEWCRCEIVEWRGIREGPPFVTAHDVKEWVQCRGLAVLA